MLNTDCKFVVTKRENSISCVWHSGLTHWSLVTPYGAMDPGLHWMRQSFIAYSTPSNYLKFWIDSEIWRIWPRNSVKFQSKHYDFFIQGSVFKMPRRASSLKYWPMWWKICFCGCSRSVEYNIAFNTLKPRQNGRHFADDPFKRIFLNETLTISIKISLNFVPKGPINNIPALVQIMAWRRRGDKPLSEPMMVSLLTHICVTWSQWVEYVGLDKESHFNSESC